MVLVEQFAEHAVDRYADVLTGVAGALRLQDVDLARLRLSPVAGELWNGSVAASRTSAEAEGTPTPRAVTDSTRAAVFVRDQFRCSRCGGRGVARSVLVAVSDVFPDEFAYDPHYGRGRIHPAFWALALEADHTAPHSRGGSPEASNLTAMHALCNTAKADADLDELAEVPSLDERRTWDGLLSAYPDIVLAGETHGRRHSSPRYHAKWMRLLTSSDLPDAGLSPATDGSVPEKGTEVWT